MAPIVIAARILTFIATNPAIVEDVVKATQSTLSHLPGNERFNVVKGIVTEALDMTDPDDKAWEKAWRIARPFFDALVAKVKGKAVAAVAGAAAQASAS